MNESLSAAPRRSVILIASVVIMLCVGILYMWSIFSPFVCDLYNWGVEQASITGSIMLATFVVGIIAGGKLQTKFGSQKVVILGSILFAGGIFLTSLVTAEHAWLIYVSYGVISGLGVGIAYASALACSQSWFEDKKGLASGATIAAFGLSVVIFSPIAEALLTNYGPVATFRIFALVFLVICLICSLALKDKPRTAADSSDSNLINGVRQYKMSELFKQKEYYLVTLILFLMTPTYFIVIPLLKTLGELRGLTPEIAVFGVMLTGICSCCGRFVLAVVSDAIGRRATVILETILLIGGTICMVTATGALFLAMIGLVAFAFGGIAAVMPPITGDYFGTKYLAGNYGCIMIGWGLSAIIFPIIANLINSFSGDYAVCFMLPIATTAVALLLTVLLLRKDGRSQRALPPAGKKSAN